jgi:hypothetical protein
VDEQAFQHGLDVTGLSKHAFEPRTTAPREDDGEIARTGVAEAFPVEHKRHARHEERLADDELAALCDLDDDSVGQVARPGGNA